MLSLRKMSMLGVMARLPPLRGLISLVVLIAGWQIFGPAHSPYFPPPSTWYAGLVELIHKHLLLPAIGATLLTFASGLAGAALIGGVIGVLIGISRPVNRALAPLLEFCRALPPPVVVPVGVLLLGYSLELKLLVVIWAAVWPILLNTASAAGLVDLVLLDVGYTLRLPRKDIVRKIIVPAMIPSYLLGIRVALPLAVIVTLLVEMLTLLPGVGSLIVSAQREFQSPKVYGLLVLVGLLGFILNSAFIIIETMLMRRWPPRALDVQ
jgi:ABC-type nitrate/sulfonate/bicarbonate transport system permease component